MPEVPSVSPPVRTILSPAFSPNSFFVSCAVAVNMEVIPSYTGESCGVTPQESASFRHVFSEVVNPTMSAAGRNLDTMRAVLPESVFTTIAFACTSFAMPHVAWEMASTVFLMRKSERSKRQT